MTRTQIETHHTDEGTPRSGRLRRLMHLLVLLFAALALTTATVACQPKEEDKAGEEEGEEGGDDDKEKAGEEGDEADDDDGDDEKGDDEKAEADDGDDDKDDGDDGDDAKDDDKAEKTAAADAADASGDDGAKPVVDLSKAVAATGGGENPFLAMIPADTLYTFATLSTISLEELPFDTAEMGGMYATLAEQMKKDQTSPMNKVLGAVMDELAKAMKADDGLASIGFKDGGHFALYGVGALPIARMQLSDSGKFEAFVGRIEKQSGFKAEQRDFKGTKYRAVPLPDTPAVIAAVVMDDHVAVTIATKDTLEWVLPWVTGAKKPEKHIGSTDKLTSIGKRAPNNAAGVTTGYVDLVGIQQVLAGDRTGLAAESLKALGAPLPVLQGACKNESAMLTKLVPRLVLSSFYTNQAHSVTEFTVDVDAPNFIKGLKGTVGKAPGLGAPMPAKALGFVGVGVDVDTAMAFIKSFSGTMTSKKFECKELGFINQFGQQVKRFAETQRIPPNLSELTGAFVILEDIDISGQQPKNIKALASIGTSKPQELWMMAGALSKEFAKVKLSGEPAKLPAIPNAPFVDQLYVMKTDSALGLAHGDDVSKRLKPFLASNVGGNTPLVVVGYDYGRIMKKLPKQLMQQGGMQDLAGMMSEFGMSSLGLHVVDAGVQFRFVQSLEPTK